MVTDLFHNQWYNRLCSFVQSTLSHELEVPPRLRKLKAHPVSYWREMKGSEKSEAETKILNEELEQRHYEFASNCNDGKGMLFLVLIYVLI